MNAVTFRKTLVAAGVAASLALGGAWAQQTVTRPGAAQLRPAAPAVQQKPAAPTAPAANALAADEKAIGELIGAVGKAFNDKDAKALAALFTTNAELVAEDGEVHQGREELQEFFAEAFANRPQSKIEFYGDTVRLVSPSTAIEDGASVVNRGEGEPAEHNRYTLVYVKQDGKWLVASVRDLPNVAAQGAEELAQLSFLIGDWIDESEDSLINTSYKWTDNEAFILSEFIVHIAGRPAMSGTQRIAWDPLHKRIRSWVFDSEGGFAEGQWTRRGNRWTVTLNGVTRDGKAASSTNVITAIGPDHVTWQSGQRQVDGQEQDDSAIIDVVRRPPAAK